MTERATARAEQAPAPLGSRQAHREASERDKRARRFLLRLSLANWGIAVVAWTISAFLGITSPASIIVYSVLFVIGLIAVIVALLTYLLEKFAHRPPDYEHADLEADGGEGGPTAVPPAAKDAAPAAKEAPPAGPAKDAAAPAVKDAAPAAKEAPPAGPGKDVVPAAKDAGMAAPAKADAPPAKDAAAAAEADRKTAPAQGDAPAVPTEGDGKAGRGDAPAPPAG